MFQPHWVCPVQGCLCFPHLHCSGSRLLYMEGPCVECGSSFRVLHKSADLVAPAFCAFRGLSVQAARGLSALSPDAARLFPPRRVAQAARGLGALSPGAARLFPPRRVAQAARGLAPSLRARHAFSLRGPSARALPVGSQEVFRWEPGPVCSVGGGGFAGAEFAPSPPPCLLPPAGMGRLFSGVSQSLCFVNRRWCVPAG